MSKQQLRKYVQHKARHGADARYLHVYRGQLQDKQVKSLVASPAARAGTGFAWRPKARPVRGVQTDHPTHVSESQLPAARPAFRMDSLSAHPSGGQPPHLTGSWQPLIEQPEFVGLRVRLLQDKGSIPAGEQGIVQGHSCGHCDVRFDN